MFGLEAGVLGEDLIARASCSEQPEQPRRRGTWT